MKKLLKNLFILLPVFVSFLCTKTYALEIIYPKTPNTESTADTIFIIGNTQPDAKLTINGNPVKVYDNGGFVEVVPLKSGFNRITIDSKNSSQHDIMYYMVKKVAKKPSSQTDEPVIEFKENEIIYAATARSNTPLRAQPDEYARRITHLDANTALMLNGKKGDYYRVSLAPNINVWVKEKDIVQYSKLEGKMLADAAGVNLSDDGNYNYIKTDLSFPVPYKLTETDTGLRMDLYNIKKNPADTVLFKTSGAVKSLAINTIGPDNVSSYFIELNQKLWGYDVCYEGNTLVLKIRKAPDIDKQKPLNGLTIAIDAGHGGTDDDGAIGPTGVKEKDINLDIAKKLQILLENSGAKVIMTRNDDTAVDLYERIKIAQQNNALILLSLHANALEDGKNPYLKHGSASYYYNRQAINLARTMRDAMVENLGTMDDGVAMKSLAITRATLPLSVILEVGYMINPNDYALLTQDSFRQKAAQAIKSGLEKYLLNSINE